MDNENNKIEIVTGTGNNLDISEVSTHLSSIKPKIKDEKDKAKKIVIPKSNFDDEETDEDDETEE